MSLRAQWLADRPDFPWLRADDPAGVREFLVRRGWIGADEPILRCERAGEGNMNLALRVRTARRSMILKQARPWVEKYDHIEAPWERSISEQRFYTRVAGIPAVASRMPALLASDAAAHALLLEDLPGARDLTSLYGGDSLEAQLSEELGAWLRALHDATTGPPDAALANAAMRSLNHQHCFVVPLDASNGLDLDAFEPGLRAVANELAGDADVTARVSDLGRRYQRVDGGCLVHGDYFPGSWLIGDAGLRIIDPEFSFQGDPEVDVGCALAHLALARQPRATADRFLGAYGVCNEALIAGYAAVEVLRRLLGVAQLPIPPSHGERASLTRRARATLLSGDPGHLWS